MREDWERSRLSTARSREVKRASYDERLVRIVDRIANRWLKSLPENLWMPFKRDMERIKSMFVFFGTRDALTGLRNRRSGLLQLNSVFATSRSVGVGLMFLDIDSFKEINDRLGHEAGDNALRSLGDLISHTVREQDLAIRWGGEEFVIALLSADSRTKFLVAAERIWRQIHDPEKQKKHGYLLAKQLNLSCGAAWVEWPPNLNRRTIGAKLADTMLKVTDTLMYEDKKRWKESKVRMLQFEIHSAKSDGGTSKYASSTVFV